MSNQPKQLSMPGGIRVPHPLRSPGVPALANRTEATIRDHFEFNVRTGRVDPTDEAAMEVLFKTLGGQSLEYCNDALVAQLVSLEIESSYTTVEWKEANFEDPEAPPRKKKAFVLATQDPKLAHEVTQTIMEYFRSKDDECKSEVVESQKGGTPGPGADDPS